MVPVILFLALGLATAGCGGHAEGPRVASAPGSPTTGRTTDTAEQARLYADCLRREGVTMMQPAQGAPQADKARTPLATLNQATERCRQLAPAGDAPPQLSARDLAQRRAHSACLRAHGVPEYPDPDPQTGEPQLNDQLARRLKSNPQFTRALESCRSTAPGGPAGGAVTGG
jgi:hypothetical protein